MGNKNIPEYSTIKEIVVKGTAMGGDKKQFVFLDKNKNECTRNYNQSWREISSIGTFFFLHGLKNQMKIAIIGENCTIESGAKVGARPEQCDNIDNWGIAVTGNGVTIGENVVIPAKAMIYGDVKEGE